MSLDDTSKEELEESNEIGMSVKHKSSNTFLIIKNDSTKTRPLRCRSSILEMALYCEAVCPEQFQRLLMCVFLILCGYATSVHGYASPMKKWLGNIFQSVGSLHSKVKQIDCLLVAVSRHLVESSKARRWLSNSGEETR